MKRAIFLFLFSYSLIEARNAGIVVACSEKYAKHLFASLKILRDFHRCSLPIEIWYAGDDEISEEGKSALLTIGLVKFYDVAKVFGKEPEKYRGYHIKGFALYGSKFDEVVLMDADVIFYQNPQKLLDHPKTIEYGAYFFRDREEFQFYDYDQTKLEYNDRYLYAQFTYQQRKAMVLNLIPYMPSSIPEDWAHYWNNSRPQHKKPIPSEHQDAGCMVIDKRRAVKGCQLIRLFNENHDIFYKYILGDKETYWLALASVNETFYVNPCHPYRLRMPNEERDMFHLLDEKPFFLQKSPIYLDLKKVQFLPTGKLHPKKSLTFSEIQYLNIIYQQFQKYLYEYETLCQK